MKTLKRIGRGVLITLALAGTGVFGLVLGTVGYLGLMAAMPFVLVLYPITWAIHLARMGGRRRRDSQGLQGCTTARCVTAEVKAFARTRRGR